MPIFSLEHSPAAYRADFILYGLASIALAAFLGWATPRGQGATVAAVVLAGALGWTLAEYLLHRFVLHGLPPFEGWHARHHQRPTALIGSPTVFSASLFGLMVFLPVWWLGGWLTACAATLGMAGGYLAYAMVHHATHHANRQLVRRAGISRWLTGRRRWHALHHSQHQTPCHFGVTTSFWDRVFGTAPASRAPSVPTTPNQGP